MLSTSKLQPSSILFYLVYFLTYGVAVQGVDIALFSGLEINVAIICASVPALKPLVVKMFPKMLLSDLYARSKRAYYPGAENIGTTSGTGNTRSQTQGTRTDIKVVQSIEMKSVPTTGYEEGKTSRDGSEKNLVTSTWQADCYSTNTSARKATIKSQPNEMV